MMTFMETEGMVLGIIIGEKGKVFHKFGSDFNSPSGYFYLSSTPLLLKLFEKHSLLPSDLTEGDQGPRA